MRLEIVAHGHAWPQKLMLGALRIAERSPVLDVVKLLLYRPEFFGRAFGIWTQSVMRGSSDWSVAERELFAVFISNVNECPF